MRIARMIGLGVALAALVIGVMGFGVMRRASANEAITVGDIAAAGAPLCRYGVNMTGGFDSFAIYDMAPLRLGWYLNYLGVPATSQPATVDFVPVIRLTQTSETAYTYSPRGAALTNAILASPGVTWLIGNEPDRRGSIQDNVEPHVYAAAYHELYHLIKATDPSAKIFAGTIVQPTPLRLRYLDMVLASYYQSYGQAMPVDGWSIHNFILNEVSCDYDPGDCWGADVPPGINEPFGERVSIDANDDYDRFVERIVRFRRWMKAHGYGERPLYLTEYGILMPPDYGFGAARVNTFMNKTFDYMTAAIDPAIGMPADGYRLVQKWSWYSTTDRTYNGWLFDIDSRQITAIGQNFANHSSAIAITNDLVPWRLLTTPATLHYTGTPLSVQLRAQVSNSGNPGLPAGPAVVRFYRGDPVQGGTQIGADKIVNLAGCGESAEVSVTWNGVTAGVHRIFVVVDAGGAIAESNETNNTQSFIVLVGTRQIFTPSVAR